MHLSDRETNTALDNYPVFRCKKPAQQDCNIDNQTTEYIINKTTIDAEGLYFGGNEKLIVGKIEF